jgi:hypothetical protein
MELEAGGVNGLQSRLQAVLAASYIKAQETGLAGELRLLVGGDEFVKSLERVAAWNENVDLIAARRAGSP